MAREHVPCPLAHAAHGPPGPARSHSARQAMAHPAHRHAPTPRTGLAGQIRHHSHALQDQYGFTSGCPRHSLLTLLPRHQNGPARPRPVLLTRMTHGSHWPPGDPFASHSLTRESRGQGVFLQMGGPPNTFTGATQPIPVGSDGSVQAGLPDANAGRDTRGVVNKYSTPRCVSPHAMRLRVR